MKSIDLLALLIKVVSIFLFVKALSSGMGFYVYVIEGSLAPDSLRKSFQLVTLGSYVLMLCASILMWSFPATIAKWFIPRSNDQRYPNIDLNLQSLEIVSFSIIGIYILSWAIPDMVHNLSLLKLAEGNLLYNEQYASGIKINTLVTAIEIGIGVILCIFSGNLSKLLATLRR